MTASSPPYVPFIESIEQLQADEAADIERIVASMARVSRKVFDKHRHATRDAHAKSHGILRGELAVHPGLPPHLRQGLFAEPRRYPVIARFSTAPGDLHSDKVPAPRGLALKLLGVDGPRLLPDPAQPATQDFLLVNHPVIPFGHVKAYLEMQEILERHGDVPDTARRLLAGLALGASKALGALGIENPTVDAIGTADHHILGETFHSMAALRFGQYIAKLSAAPLSPEVRALTGVQVRHGDSDSALRDLVVAHFRQYGAQYELRAQLCTDITAMPVEDASIRWSEVLSPQQSIATLSFEPQEAYSPARRVYADDVLSFNPWHGIEAHRPLGSIMRVRRQAYERSSRFRHEMNMQPRREPASVDELPA
jgi:hypothetical protein